MQLRKRAALTVVAVFLMSWNFADQRAQAGNNYFCAGPVGMMQEQLVLTDDQAAAVQEVFTYGQEKMNEILAGYGLERSDLRTMQQEMAAFRKQAQSNLAEVLDKEQIQTLRKEIVENESLLVMELSEDERSALVQDVLDVGWQEAAQVAEILEEGRGRRQEVVKAAGCNREQMEYLRQDIKENRSELEQSLREILTEVQMESFVELRNRMQQKNSGHGFPLMVRSGQL